MMNLRMALTSRSLSSKRRSLSTRAMTVTAILETREEEGGGAGAGAAPGNACGPLRPGLTSPGHLSAPAAPGDENEAAGEEMNSLALNQRIMNELHKFV